MSAIAARKARLAAEAQARAQSQQSKEPRKQHVLAASSSPARSAQRQRQSLPDESSSHRKKARLEAQQDTRKRSSRSQSTRQVSSDADRDQIGSEDDEGDEGEDEDEDEDDAQSAASSSSSSLAISGTASDEADVLDDLHNTRTSSPASSVGRRGVTKAQGASKSLPSSQRQQQQQRRKWWRAKRPADGSIHNVFVTGSSSTGNTVTIGLQEDEWLSFYGIVTFSVVQGSVEVNHCRLDCSSSPQQMFCPHTDPLPAIRAFSSGQDTQAAASETPGLEASHFAAIVRFTTLTGTGLEHLPLVCPLAGPDPFGALPAPATAMRRWGSSSSDAASQIHLPFFHTSTDEARLFDAPSSWIDALTSTDSSKSASSFLVRGPKGVGKSTLSRSLLNVLLQRSSPGHRVAFLDLDPGQAELNAPGTVSLQIFDSSTRRDSMPMLFPSWLTPSATLPQSFSHYLGQVTPKDIPSVYLSAIESLLARLNDANEGDAANHQRRQNKLPGAAPTTRLVVNTMGWTKGLGSELGSRIEALIRPDVIFDLQARVTDYGEASSYQSMMLHPSPSTMPPYRDAYGGVIHPGARVVPLHGYYPAEGTVTPSSQLLPAADRRTLSIMTALHSTAPSVWEFRTPLIEQRPFFVDVKQADLRMGYVPASTDSVSSEEEVERRIMALNGELVALCSSQPRPPQDTTANTAADKNDSLSAWKTRFFSSHLQPAHLCTFHSLAIVRSIDMVSSTISLLLPRNAGAHLATLQSPTLVASHPSLSQTLSLPVWAHLDASSIKRAMRGWPAVSANNSHVYEDAIAGVPLDRVPFLDFPEVATADDNQGGEDFAGAESHGTIVGGQRRRIRRNLMRKNQM